MVGRWTPSALTDSWCSLANRGFRVKKAEKTGILQRMTTKCLYTEEGV